MVATGGIGLHKVNPTAGASKDENIEGEAAFAIHMNRFEILRRHHLYMWAICKQKSLFIIAIF